MRGRKKYFYNRTNNRAVKKALHRIGITKHKAKYLLQTLLGDASAPSDLEPSLYFIVIRSVCKCVSLGEDIICDLQENKGRIRKHDAFWDIVDEYIQKKAVSDDRRHGSKVDVEIVVTVTITYRRFVPAIFKNHSLKKSCRSFLETMVHAPVSAFF